MLTLSTNIQSYLSAIRLSSTTLWMLSLQWYIL